MTPITPAQRRTIFSQCNWLGLDVEERRALQWRVCRKGSLADFSRSDAKAFIDHLIKNLGAPKPKEKRKPVRPPKLPDNVILFITPKQRTKIEIMAGQVVWREEDGFEKWMLASFGFRAPRTNHEVDKVIHGLDSLKAQQQQKERAG